MAAWNELEEIDGKNRGTNAVLGLRLDVCRKLGQLELSEELARTLIAREPNSIMHIVALAEVMAKREGPIAAAAVYEFAVDRFPDFASLPAGGWLSLAKPERCRRTIERRPGTAALQKLDLWRARVSPRRIN
jgi:hypothetical protein